MSTKGAVIEYIRRHGPASGAKIASVLGVSRHALKGLAEDEVFREVDIVLHLQDVFNRYAPEEYDYSFQRSEIRVKLYRQEYVSRSEGRRLVSGLDSFRHVILDFAGVTSIRQGFADEVFRVFRNSHPNMLVEVRNANPAVEQMIKHVGGDYQEHAGVDN